MEIVQNFSLQRKSSFTRIWEWFWRKSSVQAILWALVGIEVISFLLLLLPCGVDTCIT